MVAHVRQKATHQRNVDQLNQPPAGHKGISQVFDGLDHPNQLHREEQESEIKCSLAQNCLKSLVSVLTSAFLSLITVVHLLTGGKSRSTVYQLTPPLNLVGRRKVLMHSDGQDMLLTKSVTQSGC